MNILNRKLRSNAGASMLLAMVFMLFCVMIGGTVLAAAAANGYRINRLSDSQEYLNQRSAAMLIAQELKTSEDTQLRVTITDVSRTIQPVKIERNGQIKDSGAAVTTHSVTVQFPTGMKMSSLQRVMMEASIWQYLKEAGLTETGDVTLVNFVYDDGDEGVAVTHMDQFWYQYRLGSGADFTGSMELSGTLFGDNAIAQEISFAAGTGDDLYDFTFGFGEDSHISVCVDANFTQKSPMNSSYVVNYDASSTGYARISTNSNQVAIIWTDPIIEKGGN